MLSQLCCTLVIVHMTYYCYMKSAWNKNVACRPQQKESTVTPSRLDKYYLVGLLRLVAQHLCYKGSCGQRDQGGKKKSRSLSLLIRGLRAQRCAITEKNLTNQSGAKQYRHSIQAPKFDGEDNHLSPNELGSVPVNQKIEEASSVAKLCIIKYNLPMISFCTIYIFFLEKSLRHQVPSEIW